VTGTGKRGPLSATAPLPSEGRVDVLARTG